MIPKVLKQDTQSAKQDTQRAKTGYPKC